MMRAAAIAVAAGVFAAQAWGQTSYPPADTAAISAQMATIQTQMQAAYDAIPFARTKWAGQNLLTNSAGVWTGTIPPGRMVTGLSVSGVVVHTSGQFMVPNVIATGNPVTGYTVTVTFTKAKTSVQVPAVVLGAAALNLSLFETPAATGVVSFDISFAEPAPAHADNVQPDQIGKRALRRAPRDHIGTGAA